MRRLKFVSIILFVLFFMSEAKAHKQANRLSKKEKNGGWELLFNGIDFTGWRGINLNSFPVKGWKVKNEAIACLGENGGDIITLSKYENFELHWEWKMVTAGTNSGVKYFVNELEKQTGGYGYGIEYQLLDSPDHNQNSLGGAYDLYETSTDTKPNKLGEWNYSKIVSINGKVEHWLNGKKILEYDRFSDDFKKKVAGSKFKNIDNFGLHKNGNILLQDHNCEIYFRTIKILKL